MSTKHSKFYRLLSLLLVCTMLFELLPANALAVGEEETVSPVVAPEEAVETVESIETEIEEEKPQEVTVLGEMEELREENVKHFRMSDGTFTAISYDRPVHYADADGQWQDIDNSLSYQVATADTAATYSTGAGSFGVSYAAELTEDLLFTTQDGAISLMWGMGSVGDELAVEEENVLQIQDMSLEEPAESAELDTTTTAELVSEPIEAQVISPAAELTLENDYTQLTPGTQNSTLVYEDILPDIDLQYETNAFSIKESIVVNAPQESYVYSFRLQLDGLTPTLEDGGHIHLTDNEGTIQYLIPAPYMLDAAYDFCFGAAYELEALGDDLWLLTVTADADWMNEEDRAYPVLIDPTIVKESGSASGDISSTYVVEGEPTTSHPAYQQLYLGKTTYQSAGWQDVYLHVNNLPAIPYNCSVVAASISYVQNGYSGASGTNMYVAAYELTNEGSKTSSQSYQNWIHGLTWNTRPSNSTTILDYAKLNTSTAGYYQSWDVTAAAIKWYPNASTNHGILLKRWDNDGLNKGVLLMNYGSSTPSFFAVSYRNNVGIESYYSYQTQSVDRAGMAYMGDYSGHLTVATPLVSYDSAVNGYSLSLVYNSANAIMNFTGNTTRGLHTQGYSGLVGAGWKLSAQETVYEIELPGYNNTKNKYLVYNDGDGTEHYFTYDSSKQLYYDEDGLNMQISKSGSTYTMRERPSEDSGANNNTNAKRVFYKGYLTEIHDNNDNAIYFLYRGDSFTGVNSDTWKPDTSTDQQLKKIVQVNKNAAQKTIVSFTYGDNGYLESITDFAGRITKFFYDDVVAGTQYLVKIEWPDGKTADYTYDGSHYRMTSLHDNESGYGLNISYLYFRERQAVYQVREYVSFNGGSKALGNAWHAYHHSRDMMEYRYYGADQTANSYDDIVARYSFDYMGRTVNAVNLDTNKKDILGVSASSFTRNSDTSAKNNRLSGAGASGMTATNLLLNTGAEILSSSNNSGALGWTSSYTTGVGNALVSGAYDSDDDSKIKPRTGQKLLKAYINSTSLSTQLIQSVYLFAGNTYTLSAYVNTKGETATDFGSGGAFVAIANSSNAIQKQSAYVNYPTANSIDGGWERISVVYTPASNGYYRAVLGVEKSAGALVAAFDDIQLEVGKSQSNANLLQYASFETVSSTGSATITGNENYWADNGGDSVAISIPAYHGSSSMRIYGSLSSQRRAYQEVQIQDSAQNTWLLSGWAKANSVANTQPDPDHKDAPDDRFFGLVAKIHYTDNTTENHYVPFCDDYTDWQYASGIVAPKERNKTVGKITVYTAYDYNGNTAWFDDLSLRAEPVETYKYDEDGNLEAVNATDNSSDAYTYTGPDLKQATTGVTGTFNYTYDGNHNMTKATTNSDNTLDVTYDDRGNATGSKWYATSQPGGEYLETSTDYSDDGRLIESQEDANGVKVEHTYYSLKKYDGLRYSTKTNLKDPETGKDLLATTVYNYYEGNHRLSRAYQSGMISVDYAYDEGRMSAISRKSYPRNLTTGALMNTAGNEKWQSYKFVYDTYGNPWKIYISGSDSNSTAVTSADEMLVNYSYEPGGHNTRMSQMRYANGAYVNYTYDLFDRVIKERYNDGTEYHYFYDTEGNLSRQCCVQGGEVTAVYVFEYDSLGRLIRSKQTSDGTLRLSDRTVDEGTTVQRTEHLYDNENRITSQSWQLGSRTYTESYTYNDNVESNTTGIKDGSLATMAISPLGKTLSFSYDSLKHLSKVTVPGVYAREYDYETLSGNRSSNRISRVDHTQNGNTNFSRLYYDYVYDKAGNITTVKQNGSQIAKYRYDEQGQLIEETRAGGTYRYTYDTAGNILDVTVSGIYNNYEVFTYGNDTWKDLLTTIKIGNTTKNIAYEGQTYNASTNVVSGTPVFGNPINWYNGNNLINLEWSRGRQLTSLVKKINNTTEVDISYTYDMSGIRSSKKVGSDTYHYITQNGQVVRQTWGSNILDIVYDNNGQPFALSYAADGVNFDDYYYITNVQGDVVRLVDDDGATVANYTYDAWGKVLSVTNASGATITDTNNIANINPIRYRGYYYNTETGWYYVSSRYYDPEIGRFINADDVTMLGANGDFASVNLFAYCGNNPVSRKDIGGNFWNIVIGAAVGGLVSGITTAIDSYVSTGSIDWGKVGISAAVGAINGGVAATGLGVFVQAGITAGVSAVGSAATDLYERSQKPNGGRITWKEVGGIALRAVGSAAIGFGSSIFGTAAGKVVSGNLEARGSTMVFRGKVRAGCWTKAQARNMVARGKTLINTARGVSSVIGTLFTWPTSTALSYGMSYGGKR